MSNSSIWRDACHYSIYTTVHHQTLYSSVQTWLGELRDTVSKMSVPNNRWVSAKPRLMRIWPPAEERKRRLALSDEQFRQDERWLQKQQRYKPPLFREQNKKTVSIHLFYPRPPTNTPHHLHVPLLQKETPASDQVRMWKVKREDIQLKIITSEIHLTCPWKLSWA